MTSQASLSLSLLLTKVTHAQYRKRFRASYNIGSASALPIIYRDRKPGQHVTVGLARGSPQLLFKGFPSRVSPDRGGLQ